MVPRGSREHLYDNTGSCDLPRTDEVVFPRNFQNYTYIGMIQVLFQTLSQRIFLPIGDCAENRKNGILNSQYIENGSSFASKFTTIGKELKTPLLCMRVKIFLLFVLRMKLLRQVSRTWKTDGLNSCSYKLLSVEHNPLYINITVDFSVQPEVSQGPPPPRL